MLCGRFAVGPNRRSVLPNATQPMLQLSAAGVPVTIQLTFYESRLHESHCEATRRVRPWLSRLAAGSATGGHIVQKDDRNK